MLSSSPVFRSLCDDVVLLVWTLPGVVEGACVLSGPFDETIAPLSSVKLRDVDGNTRVIWALKRPSSDGVTLVAAAGGQPSTPVTFVAPIPPVGDELFEHLTPEARLALSSAILGSWASLFKLQGSASFARTLRMLFKAPEASSPVQLMFVAGGVAATEITVPRGFGELKSATLVYPGYMRALKLTTMTVRPADRGTGTRRFVCDLPAGPPPSFIIFRSANGFVARNWPANTAQPSIEAWWKKTGGQDPALREEAIMLLNRHSPVARAASVEFQLRCPLKPSAVVGSQTLPGASIELALAGSAGLLVNGWFRDPLDFVAGFDALDHTDTPHPLDGSRFDYPGKVAGPKDGTARATGFISFVPQIKGPLQQPRFLMRLKSGARHLMIPRLQPLDWPEARAAALRAVPPQALREEVISTCLAPMLADFQRAAQQSIGAPVVKQIGTPVEHPHVSIIIPLYRVLDFLPFQIAAFASDPQILFRCELIYVLDSPEQAETVEHLLTGLHLVYGIPIKLAVMSRNGGYSFANNRAAALARGSVLALVNSDVIPTGSGWVGLLEQRLGSDAVGAVGPKLLYEDDSIQHAGLFFSPDHRGRWLNQHYFKGMPRRYSPATFERSVPGITGACMVMKRDQFERVGGFTEDYVIGDYEDSDLCLKIRADGKDIVYVPDAELYHLERRSMTQSADYMRGAASQYNSWLHQQRWGDAMKDLMARYTALLAPGQRKVA